jgi:iron complex outermembrane receptor protein
LVLQHQFANEWTLYAGAYTVFYEFPGSMTQAAAPIPTPFGPVPARLRSDFEDQESSSSLIVNLAGDVETGLGRHRLLFGTVHVYYDTDSTFRTSILPAIDFNNPVYVNPPSQPAFVGDFPVFRQTRHGYYLQDYVELNEYWQLLAGVRFDDIDFTFERNLGLGPVHTEQRFERTTPRAGIVFQPFPDVLSTYFVYSRSFNPPGGGGFPFTADPVRPELGESYEAGEDVAPERPDAPRGRVPCDARELSLLGNQLHAVPHAFLLPGRAGA